MTSSAGESFMELKPRRFIHDQAESSFWFMVPDCSSAFRRPEFSCNYTQLSMENHLTSNLCWSSPASRSVSAERPELQVHDVRCSPWIFKCSPWLNTMHKTVFAQIRRFYGSRGLSRAAWLIFKMIIIIIMMIIVIFDFIRILALSHAQIKNVNLHGLFYLI